MDLQRLGRRFTSLKEAYRAVRKTIHWLRCPGLQRRGAQRLVPVIEAGCEFTWPSRITVGDGVQFYRGSVLLADPVGEMILENRAVVCRYVIIQSLGGTIRIGENSVVGDFCSLYGQGNLTIGRDVMLAGGCRVVPNQHTFAIKDLPVSAQPCTALGITIEDGAWLGSNVVVLDGVRIGRGAVVGAGSVVTKSVPDYAIAVGVPARVVRLRPGHELVDQNAN